MKSAVVFYSYDGSTRVAASVLAGIKDSAIFELEEARKRGKSRGSFIAAGFSASVGKKSRLKNNYASEMKRYDRIYIGTPVWAGKPTPAINSFIRKADLKGREIMIFTVQADPDTAASSSKATDILRSALEKRGANVVKTARLHGAPPGKTSSEDEMRNQIEEKLI
jgi:menaquinone-dependent protoporphyrinogen IX oxidase